MTSLSNTLLVLLNEYPGDDAWEQFVSNFPEVCIDHIDQNSIDADILKVLYWKKGRNAERVLRWLGKPIPALDGNTVFNIMEMQEGRTILRTAIMRMP
jgi:hypothetical protein